MYEARGIHKERKEVAIGQNNPSAINCTLYGEEFLIIKVIRDDKMSGLITQPLARCRQKISAPTDGGQT